MVSENTPLLFATRSAIDVVVAAAAAPNLFDMKHTLISLLYYYFNNNKTIFETENDTPNEAMLCDVCAFALARIQIPNAMMA